MHGEYIGEPGTPPKCPRCVADNYREATTMMPTTMTTLMSYIAAARKKHSGALTTDMVRAHLIWSEEAGEFAKELCDITRVHADDRRDRDRFQPGSWEKVEHELMQTLAVGVEMYENIQKIKQERSANLNVIKS